MKLNLYYCPWVRNCSIFGCSVRLSSMQEVLSLGSCQRGRPRCLYDILLWSGLPSAEAMIRGTAIREPVSVGNASTLRSRAVDQESMGPVGDFPGLDHGFWFSVLWCCWLDDEKDIHHHHTTPQPFYGTFSGTTRVSLCQKRTSGIYGAGGD